MEISTMMMTSAAISAVRNTPMKLVPPTISAMGRAMSVKLTAAPAVATASTSSETKKYTIEEEDSTETARSSPRTIASYSSICRSIVSARAMTLSTLLATCPRVSVTRRQSGIIRRSSECRSPLDLR